jgi:hypothetical protein
VSYGVVITTSYGAFSTNIVTPLPNFTLTFVAEAGSDTFVFPAGFGDATIAGFDPLEDVIEFQNSSMADFATVMDNTKDDGQGNAIIVYDDVGGEITLQSVTRAMLQASNFDFV